MRQLVAGREHEMPAMDAPPIGRRRRHAALARRNVDDILRRKNPRAVGGRRLQERQRGLARIDREVAVTHQRGGARDPEPRRAAPCGRGSGSAGRRPAAPHARARARRVQHIAGEIERVASRDVGHAQLVEARGERVHREARATPGAHRLLLADLAREHDQRRVDLVLHERGAGDRRALGEAAPVDDGDLARRRRRGRRRSSRR